LVQTVRQFGIIKPSIKSNQIQWMTSCNKAPHQAHQKTAGFPKTFEYFFEKGAK
jgi:hypothetical protein